MMQAAAAPSRLRTHRAGGSVAAAEFCARPLTKSRRAGTQQRRDDAQRSTDYLTQLSTENIQFRGASIQADSRKKIIALKRRAHWARSAPPLHRPQPSRCHTPGPSRRGQLHTRKTRLSENLHHAHTRCERSQGSGEGERDRVERLVAASAASLTSATRASRRPLSRPVFFRRDIPCIAFIRHLHATPRATPERFTLTRGSQLARGHPVPFTSMARRRVFPFIQRLFSNSTRFPCSNVTATQPDDGSNPPANSTDDGEYCGGRHPPAHTSHSCTPPHTLVIPQLPLHAHALARDVGHPKVHA